MITIEEFKKLDLRIGTIKSAEPHPQADRLLVLTIDLGSEERQIVAGIRGHYTPEELLGRQIVVVANLQPAKLRGIVFSGPEPGEDLGRYLINQAIPGLGCKDERDKEFQGIREVEIELGIGVGPV